MKKKPLHLNELRVGNIIRMISDIEDNYFKVLEIGGTMKCWDFHDNAGGFWDARDFEAVELTPEILEKCGFKYRNEVRGYGMIMDFADPLEEKDWKRSMSVAKLHGKPGFTHLGSDRVAITSVHQLQNLYFAITGQELEIKL